MVPSPMTHAPRKHVTVQFQGMMETEMCFWETCFRFHPVTVPFQGMTETETCFWETCFGFHQSLVNSEKNDPVKLGRANMPAAGGFARGQKKQIPLFIGPHCGRIIYLSTYFLVLNSYLAYGIIALGGG